MIDNLFKNIGDKIKGLARGIFIVEAIGSIISGLTMMFIDEDLILYGFCTMILGPIAAWVGSWLLYAFGELVEKTSDNANYTKAILDKLNSKKPDETKAEPRYTNINTGRNTINTAVTSTDRVHCWRCERCGLMRTKSPCEHCGNLK